VFALIPYVGIRSKHMIIFSRLLFLSKVAHDDDENISPLILTLYVTIKSTLDHYTLEYSPVDAIGSDKLFP
jgi:hypothetical protein